MSNNKQKIMVFKCDDYVYLFKYDGVNLIVNNQLLPVNVDTINAGKKVCKELIEYGYTEEHARIISSTFPNIKNMIYDEEMQIIMHLAILHLFGLLSDVPDINRDIIINIDEYDIYIDEPGCCYHILHDKCDMDLKKYTELYINIINEMVSVTE